MADQTQSITVEPNSQVVHVLVKHKLLDSNTAIEMQTFATHAGRGKGLPVVLDLSNVQYMSSMAIGCLVAMMRELRTTDQRLIIVGLRQQIRQVLAITKVDRVLEMYPTVNDVMTRLAPAA